MITVTKNTRSYRYTKYIKFSKYFYREKITNKIVAF